jgi:hypothetical protein
VPNIPGLPADLRELKGVEMSPPPAEFLQDTIGVIGRALESAKLGDDDRGKLVWVATKTGDQIRINAAVVARVSEGVIITAWIGKKGTWGEPLEAGVAGQWTF